MKIKPFVCTLRGTVDFGETKDNRFLLIEAHEPFACGWYGSISEYKIFAEWVMAGWEYIKNKNYPTTLI